MHQSPWDTLLVLANENGQIPTPYVNSIIVDQYPISRPMVTLCMGDHLFLVDPVTMRLADLVTLQALIASLNDYAWLPIERVQHVRGLTYDIDGIHTTSAQPWGILRAIALICQPYEKLLNS